MATSTPNLDLDLIPAGTENWSTAMNGNLTAIDTAVGALKASVDAASASVPSVFGRTGAVTAQTGDYSFPQISGMVSASQLPQIPATDIIGVLPVANGGTGATIGVDALENLGGQAIGEKGQPNGYASLDANGLLPSSQLPPIAIDRTFVVTSQDAMLALAANVGDVAIRSDINVTFILQALPPTTLGSWQQILTPASPVQSVNGQVGNVNLTVANIAGAASLGANTFTGTQTAPAFLTQSGSMLVNIAATGISATNSLGELNILISNSIVPGGQITVGRGSAQDQAQTVITESSISGLNASGASVWNLDNTTGNATLANVAASAVNIASGASVGIFMTPTSILGENGQVVTLSISPQNGNATFGAVTSGSGAVSIQPAALTAAANSTGQQVWSLDNRTGAAAFGSLSVASEAGSASLVQFGQISTASPKQLIITNAPDSNLFTLQTLQQGVSFTNQTLQINPSGGLVTIGNSGLVVGGFSGGPSFAIGGERPDTEGFCVLWNQSGGLGETDFVNSKGAGVGGFNFYNIGDFDGLTEATSPIASISAEGTLTVSQLTLTGAEIGGSANAGSGTASALPSVPSGYLTIILNGVSQKIPLYN